MAQTNDTKPLLAHDDTEEWLLQLRGDIPLPPLPTKVSIKQEETPTKAPAKAAIKQEPEEAPTKALSALSIKPAAVTIAALDALNDNLTKSWSIGEKTSPKSGKRVSFEEPESTRDEAALSGAGSKPSKESLALLSKNASSGIVKSKPSNDVFNSDNATKINPGYADEIRKLSDEGKPYPEMWNKRRNLMDFACAWKITKPYEELRKEMMVPHYTPFYNFSAFTTILMEQDWPVAQKRDIMELAFDSLQDAWTPRKSAIRYVVLTARWKDTGLFEHFKAKYPSA